MELDIHTLDGGTLNIEDFEQDSVMSLIEDLKDGQLLTFALDDGMAYIPTAAVARIDVTD